MKILPLLALVLLLAGCGEARRQFAANAYAGVETLAKHDLTPEGRNAVAAGVQANILTTAEVKTVAELPPPTMVPAAIAANPQAYQQEAESAAAAFWESHSIWTWAGGGLLALLGIIRLIPGAHQPIVGLVQSVLENRIDRAAREKEARLAQAARGMIGVVEALPPEVAQVVKDAVNRKLPSAANDAIKAWLAEQDAKA